MSSWVIMVYPSLLSNGGHQLYAWFPGYTWYRVESLSSDIWYNVIATFTTGQTGTKKFLLMEILK